MRIARHRIFMNRASLVAKIVFVESRKLPCRVFTSSHALFHFVFTNVLVLKYLLTLYILTLVCSSDGQGFSQLKCLSSRRYTLIPVLCHALRPRKSLFAKLQHLLQPLRVHVRRGNPRLDLVD